MDFTVPQHIQELAERVRQFVDEVVVPVEKDVIYHERGVTMEEIRALRQEAKARGLWAPTMPKELGGMGLNIEEIIPVFEAAGRSLLGPLAIHAAAPDEGNMHTLHTFCTPEQTEIFF
jgi:acyl-CoA dehydrogenase